MRLPSVPGPGAVLSAVGGVREGIADALALVPRLGAVVGRVEALVDRGAALVERIESVVDRAEAAISGVEATRGRADAAIDRVARTQRKADDAITAVGRTSERAGGTLTRAEAMVGQAEAMIGRAEPLVGDYAEPLARLAPSVRRLAETLDPHEVEALVTLLDRLPALVGHLDDDILPVLASLDNVAPDVHALLDTLQDMREVVKGFPGSRLFRRRGREEIAEEEAGEDGAEATAGA